MIRIICWLIGHQWFQVFDRRVPELEKFCARCGAHVDRAGSGWVRD